MPPRSASTMADAHRDHSGCSLHTLRNDCTPVYRHAVAAPVEDQPWVGERSVVKSTTTSVSPITCGTRFASESISDS